MNGHVETLKIGGLYPECSSSGFKTHRAIFKSTVLNHVRSRGNGSGVVKGVRKEMGIGQIDLAMVVMV